MNKKQLSAAALRAVLRYEPDTGKWFWLQRNSKRIYVGKEAGSLHSTGYVLLKVFGYRYKAHVLAWFYMTGEWPSEMDHKDNNKANNRWENLRLATHAQNSANRPVQRNNKLGVKGVSLDKRYGKYVAKCGRKHLGLFNTVDEASAAYKTASKEQYGEFAP